MFIATNFAFTEKIEGGETKSYSILEKDVEHPRKMEDFYQPNIVTPRSVN